MEILKPNYCNKFKCIAEKCKHSCCVGWEIDIDEKSQKRYAEEKGNLGERLRQNIKTEDGCYSFILTENERCPFLSSKNLCDLIIEKGEEYLCYICKEHPRFYNEYETHTEMGLGMCCEEAARLILDYDFSFTCNEPDFDERNKIFEFIKDEKIPFADKIKYLEKKYQVKFTKDTSYWIDKLLSLEMLEEEWKTHILLLSGKKELILPENPQFSAEFERITLYLIYRWYYSELCINANSLNEYFAEEIMGFIIISIYIMSTIFSFGEQSAERLCEICRLYSSEIEYSSENPTKLLGFLFE